MTIYCVICKKEPIPNDSSRSFHAFPKNEKMRKKWFAAVAVSEIKKNSAVCSDHFDYNTAFNSDAVKRRRLCRDSVPISDNKSETSNIDSLERECSLSDQSLHVDSEAPLLNSNINCKGAKERKRPFSSNVDDCSHRRKKFRFNDGHETFSIRREDFVSEETWKRFMKVIICRRRNAGNKRKIVARMQEKIIKLKEVIRCLIEKGESETESEG